MRKSTANDGLQDDRDDAADHAAPLGTVSDDDGVWGEAWLRLELARAAGTPALGPTGLGWPVAGRHGQSDNEDAGDDEEPATPRPGLSC